MALASQMTHVVEFPAVTVATIKTNPIVVHLLNKTRRHNMNYNTFELDDPTLYQSSELFFSPESAEQLHMTHYPPQKSNPKTY